MYKGIYYIYIVAKNTVDQKKKILFQMINHAVFLLFSLFLYQYVYELLPGLQSKLPFPNTVWSMSMYFIVFWLGIRNLQKNFKEDIRSGNIEIYLLRPIGYIWQKVLIQIGQGFVAFCLALILSVGIDYLLVGFPEVHTPVFLWIVGVCVIFILSQILTCLLMILCGLSGFWLQDSEPVYFIVSKLIMIFGGAWVPVAFFPETLQLIAEYSPFGAAMAVSFTVYPNFMERFGPMVLNIVFWICISGLLVYFISKRAFRNLSVNG